MENIDIFDLFDAITEFLSEPSNEAYSKRLEDIKSKLVIRRFLPLEQKETVMLKTLYDINSLDTESFHFMSALEVSLTFNALMAYVVNIDYNIVDELKDAIYYDVFWASGVGDYILEFCEPDYSRVRQMVTTMISFENFKELLEELARLTPDSVMQLTNEFKAFKLDSNRELIKNLADIARNNDPLLTKVKDGIVDGAWNEIQKAQDKREKEEGNN